MRIDPRPLSILAALVVVSAVPLRAEIYTYVDEKGVYTITNVPPQGAVTVIEVLQDAVEGVDTAPGPLGLRPATPPETYDTSIDETCRAHGIDPDLVRALIWVESNFNPRAVSNKGARGLMQLLPETGRRFGAMNLFDPAENIRGGVKYLRFLMDLFSGNTRLSLAAYNAGENAVQRYNGIPPYRETQAYVKRIGQIYGKDLRLAAQVPIYLVRDADGNVVYTNNPPKPSADQKVEKVLK